MLWLVVALVGVALLVAGIIFFEINRKNSTAQPIWVYALLIIGGIIAVGGLVAMIVFLSAEHREEKATVLKKVM